MLNALNHKPSVNQIVKRFSLSRTRSPLTKIGIAASLWLLPAAAFAQQIPATLEENCFIEWTPGVRTSLADLCSQSSNGIEPQTAPQTNQTNQTNQSASRANSAANNQTSQPTSVEIVSDVGSEIYVNGIRVVRDARSPAQPSFNQVPVAGDPSPNFGRSRYSRRYIQYQEYYPYPSNRTQLEQYPYRRSQPRIYNPRQRF